MSSCTFMGHTNCPDSIMVLVYDTLEELISNRGVNTFYVGNHGNFDRIVYKVLCELEKKYDIKVFVVLAYLQNTKNTAYYDMEKTIYPEVLSKTPKRFAISRRNIFMIEQSQYMVCCINDTFSNSIKFIGKAMSKHLQIINVGTYDLSGGF